MAVNEYGSRTANPIQNYIICYNAISFSCSLFITYRMTILCVYLCVKLSNGFENRKWPLYSWNNQYRLFRINIAMDLFIKV